MRGAGSNTLLSLSGPTKIYITLVLFSFTQNIKKYDFVFMFMRNKLMNQSCRARNLGKKNVIDRYLIKVLVGIYIKISQTDEN